MNYVIIGVVVAILIFLACREIVCWYWKINEIKAVLTSIDVSLKDIKEKQGLVPANSAAMVEDREKEELPE